MNKTIFTVIGFLLFIIGTLALVLSFVGIQLAFLTWIDGFGGSLGFGLKLLMILGGLILIYVSVSDFEGKGNGDF